MKHAATLRKSAEELRHSGKTYPEIALQLSVSKSTLSLWLRELPKPAESEAKARRIYFLTKVQPLGAAANHKKRLDMWRELQKEAMEETKVHERADVSLLKALLSVLYWAEGTKFDRGGISFVNTDPRVAALFIMLLRRCYEIDEKRLRVRLHLHWYHPIKKTREYWSELLNIPKAQIQKAYIKKRNRGKRFRKNFMGICFIRYSDSRMRRSMLSYAFALQEIIAPIDKKFIQNSE